MVDTAAHLVDRVLLEVPVRQWVLTLHYLLRYRSAYDARLTSAVLRAFIDPCSRSIEGVRVALDALRGRRLTAPVAEPLVQRGRALAAGTDRLRSE